MKVVLVFILMLLLGLGLVVRLMLWFAQRKIKALIAQQSASENGGATASHAPHASRSQGYARSGSAQGTQTMLACHACGLHLPQHDVVFRHGKPFCSPEHADGFDTKQSAQRQDDGLN